jgi:pimeloyl-ACP methyl ester carboxylesterase
LFLESTSEHLKHEILNMLDREKANYSPKLGKALQHVELSQKFFSMNKPIYALYGDRSHGDPDQVRKALDWSHDLQRQINISVVPNACHFSMIENAEITAQILKDILM